MISSANLKISKKISVPSATKSEFHDKNFLKTEVVQYDTADGSQKLVWEDVPTPLIPPRERSYGKKKDKKDDQKEAAASK